ncbi:MAG: ZIP family metal transporter [Oscillibacter sp.]|nr:ZIP family metal transporter [Oscillibacter sp.]
MRLALCRAALGTGFTFFMTAFGAAMVFFLRGEPRPRFQKALLGFAAGVMTAASVWSLLIPAMEQTAAEARFPVWVPPTLGILAGAAFLIAPDALPGLARRVPAPRRRTALLVAAITLHNIPEGMAVGLACALSVRDGAAAGAAALALGIGIQNFPEGAAVSLPMCRECGSRGRAFLWGALSGAVEPLFGLLAVFAASLAQSLMPWLLSFAAGAMLYVTAEELMPQAHSRAGTCGYLAGFLLMMVLDVALG